MVVVLVGVSSGISGLVVSVALHAIEHLAYSYDTGTFLDGVSGSTPGQRILALLIAGMIGGAGWWVLRRWAKPVVSVEQAVGGKPMSAVGTLFNVALQIVIVGLGASIGREVAPRELGALFAGWLAKKAHVNARERRILVACGAGAGLAAVYSVPLGGALFTVEVLLAELSFATVLPAMATSAIATIVARFAVPDAPLYFLPQFTLTPSIFVWAVLIGPLLGLGALGFVWLTRFAARIRPRGWWILIVMPLVFTGVGLLSVPFPSSLGNGKSLGEVAFAATASAALLGVLTLVKVVSTTGTIAAGAAGGTLTPALAVGAALGGSLGGVWSIMWPGTPVATFAFVSAAAFLASTLRAPFTALVLVVEFTNQGPALLVPTMLAIGGSVAVAYVVGRHRSVGIA